jgi:hypothetical protein
MNTCVDCPNLSEGSWCGLMDDPEDHEELMYIEDIYSKPPGWCPLGKGDPRTYEDEYVDIIHELYDEDE